MLIFAKRYQFSSRGYSCLWLHLVPCSITIQVLLLCFFVIEKMKKRGKNICRNIIVMTITDTFWICNFDVLKPLRKTCSQKSRRSLIETPAVLSKQRNATTLVRENQITGLLWFQKIKAQKDYLSEFQTGAFRIWYPEKNLLNR